MSSSAFSNWAKIVTCHVSAPQREQNLLLRDLAACLENVASLLRRAKLTRVRTNFVWKNLSWTHLSFTRDPRNRLRFWTAKRAKICMDSGKKYCHISGCKSPVQRGCKDKRLICPLKNLSEDLTRPWLVGPFTLRQREICVPVKPLEPNNFVQSWPKDQFKTYFIFDMVDVPPSTRSAKQNSLIPLPLGPVILKECFNFNFSTILIIYAFARLYLEYLFRSMYLHFYLGLY